MDDLLSTLFAALTVYVLLYLVWLAVRVPGREHVTLIADLATQPVLLSATLLAWLASGRAGTDARSRTAWRLISIAYALYWLGEALWCWYENVLHTEPLPSWADVAYLAFYPMLLWGLLTFPRAPRSSSARAKFWLDVALVLLAGWMVVWHLTLRPAATHGEGWTTTALAVAYPLGDLVMLFGIATVVLRGGSVRSASMMALSGGLLLIVVADLGYAHLELSGEYVSGSWPDALWVIAEWLLVASAWSACRRAPAPAVHGPAWSVPPGFSLLPYVAVAIGYGLLLTVMRPQWSDPAGNLVLASVVLTGIVVARQVMVLRENAALLARSTALAADLGRKERWFRALVQNASDIISVLDPHGRVLYASPSTTRVLGFSPEELSGRTSLELVHPDERETVRDEFVALREQPGASRSFELRALHRDGSWRWLEVYATNRLDDPAIGGIVANYRDITAHKELNEQLTRQAFYDGLTGLANRTLFLNRLQHAFGAAGRRGQVAVLFLDLDAFKVINDSLGHAAGDELLVNVARRLAPVLRPQDTLARMGGDEFTVLMTDVRQQEDALLVAERLLEALAPPVWIEGHEVSITASIGVSVSTPSTEHAADLLRQADIALYRAKAAGKAQAVAFAPTMHVPAAEQFQLATDLRRALARGELRLHYQPEVDLHTGAIVGVEALLRWQHPSLGLLGPDRFIPLAEETGAILPIGQWVLEEACRQGRAWRALLPEDRPFFVSVNLAAPQFVRGDLVEQVARVVRETSLPPACLRLEITESTMMHDIEATLQMVETVRRLGVRLAIDDFGTGYSSLSYLHRFAVDTLKIDRGFGQRLGAGDSPVAIIQAVVAAAHALGLEVTLEGLETPMQVQAARALGCEYGQGYVFAQPLPAEAISPLLMATAPRHVDVA